MPPLPEKGARPRIHVIGLPHTVCDDRYSPCAFTGKVRRFAKMIQAYGWLVTEYSNGRSESGAHEQVEILTEQELRHLTRRASEAEDYSADIEDPDLPLVFHTRMLEALKARAAPGDIVGHVFGPMPSLMKELPGCYHVELGIGYSRTDSAAPYRIYETATWMSWHLGRRHEPDVRAYEFVAPNYYDLDDWDYAPAPDGENPYYIFFGRLLATKGLQIVVEVARRMPDKRFVLCGQGDASWWAAQSPNIEVRPPVCGRERSRVLGGAQALLAPSKFIEPFCGSAVEAQLCGTPVVTAACGAFFETVEDGRTGYRCTTLGDYVAALRRAPALDRGYVSARARRLYSLETVGATYDVILSNVADLRGAGWYTLRSNRADLSCRCEKGAPPCGYCAALAAPPPPPASP